MKPKRNAPPRQHKYGENGFIHKPRFGLIIETADEKSQEKAFNKLKAIGYDPRVVTV